MSIVGVGQLSLIDLNDVTIGNTPPLHPSVGTLWIDESQTPPMLKKWNGEQWIDVGELDPNLSVIIEDITETLGNMANDNIINFQERQIIKDKLTEIIGFVISDSTSTLPTVATLDNSGKGGFYSVRKSALNAGLSSSDSRYTNVATQYNNLKSYLESMMPIKPWDLRENTKDTVINVNKQTFRDRWLQYYLAVDALATATAEKLKQNVDDIQVGGRNFVSNGDFTIPLDMANWKDSYTGQTVEIVDISTETPPFQFALHVKNITNANGGTFYGTMFEGEVANTLVNKDLTVQFWLKYKNIVQGSSSDKNGRFGELVVEGETTSGTRVYKYYPVLSTIGTNMTWKKYHNTFKIEMPTNAVRVTRIMLKHGLEGCTGEFWTTGIKVETGNKMTDWTENPLDMQGRVYKVEQQILPDKIVQIVTSSEKYQEDLSELEQKVARILTLSASSYVVTFDVEHNPVPQNQLIEIVAKLQNLTGNPTFTATPYDYSDNPMENIALDGSGNRRFLSPSKWTQNMSRIEIIAELSGYSDTITIAKLRDGGQNAITGFLTNESITLSADSNGNVGDFSSATGTFEIYDGIARKTGSAVTYSVYSTKNCNVTINSGGIYNVTAMTADTATATLRAKYNGVTIDKVLSLSKSRRGASGADGKTLYTWVKYADTPTSGMSNNPEGKEYIGIAYNKETPTPSTNYADYVWSKFKGEQGEDGQPTYTWVKYADDDKGKGMSDSPNGKLYIGLAFNKTTPQKSNNPNDYTWSLMPQNIEIGGRNLVLNSTFNNGFTNWRNVHPTYSVIPAEPDKPNSKIAKISASGLSSIQYRSAFSNTFNAKVNDEFTFSVDFKVTNFDSYDLKYPFIVEFYDSTGIRIQYKDVLLTDTGYSQLENNKWYRLSYTTKVTNPNVVSGSFRLCLFRNGEVYYREVKVEKGNKATDWSPAPEDVQEQIDEKADIEEVGNRIETIRTELQSSISLTADSINLSVDQKIQNSEANIIQQVKSDIEATAESFNIQFTDLHQELTEQREGINELKSYFKFSASGLEIGQSDSPLNIVITNEQIEFRNGSAIVAYINGQKMYITDIEVLNRIALGAHIFEKYNNDMTIIRWAGGD